ncbi:MAG TPA: glycosyltransferase family 39 protein [Arenimonas sp.]|uniref:ArnT family glycosyltransferase n=1 Tax=Arenimonas sp. TaxID=1872635 RepID=UPI002B8F9B7F|nr:glycosyltransferase family 39 protein [Arenimonas sp.]HMB58133.1 glycosyltransferase family 39 protein [Arenimonas sp.]
MVTALSTPIADGEQGQGKRFRWLMAAIFLLALILRLAFFFGAGMDHPIAGDIFQYVNYAWNLVNHGTFSLAQPTLAPVAPDAFRGPGYPAFLAIWFWLFGDSQWYLPAVLAQILIGALTAPLAIAWTRLWLPRPAALTAGLLVALWPHAIVLSSTLLSETVFCAALLQFFYWAGLAERDRSSRWAVAAGLAGGIAYLVNPIAALIPLTAAALLFFRRQRRLAALLLASYLLVCGSWSLRNAMHPEMQGAGDRIAINFVQGSWPMFHAAYNVRFEDASAQSMLAVVDQEEQLMAKNPRAGLAAVAERFSYDRLGYVRWYLIDKPYSLWSWRIRVGWGDIYFLTTDHSPFERQAVFRVILWLFRNANPVLFGLAALMAIATLARRWRDAAPGAFALTLTAASFVYVTAVHTVLQAEPRYAVAYRPLQVALAVSALLAVWRWWRARRQPAHPA